MKKLLVLAIVLLPLAAAAVGQEVKFSGYFN
jgi:hypothetical protein